MGGLIRKETNLGKRTGVDPDGEGAHMRETTFEFDSIGHGGKGKDTRTR